MDCCQKESGGLYDNDNADSPSHQPWTVCPPHICIISGILGLHWNITSSALMIKLIFGRKDCTNENTSYRTLIIRGQCFFCRMCPSQQFWQGDYLSTSCQNVAISSDPGRVAQMILPISDRQVSVMTRSQDTRLLFLPANTEALYNLLMSHKVGQRWGQRRRSGFGGFVD